MKRINLLLISSAFLIFFGCSSDGGDTENPTNQEEPDVTSEPINCQISTELGNVFAMSDQSDLFVFKERYGKCETVDGSIMILLKGNYDTEDEFANVRHINGNLTLINIDPTIDLGGLDNLVSVSGDLIYESVMPLNGGFESLETIGGDLVFLKSDVTEISGFPSLTDIGGSLIIQENENLLTVNGFPSLRTCKNVNVSFNGKLESLEAFNNLKIVQNNFSLNTNVKLTLLNDFSNLETIGGEEFNIELHPSLSIFPKFERLKTVAGNMRLFGFTFDIIDSFPVLTSAGNIYISPDRDASPILNGFNALEVIEGALGFAGGYEEINGFNKLQEVTGDFYVSGPNLTNLDFAINLKRIGGYLDISRCPKLEAINDFENLTSVGN